MELQLIRIAPCETRQAVTDCALRIGTKLSACYKLFGLGL
jgi:hypothetical protein